MKINVENYQEQVLLDSGLMDVIKQAAKLCIIEEEFSVPCQVDISLVDNEKITELNKQYREKDEATDVLSFPLLDMTDGEYHKDTGDVDPDTDEVLLGDIVISVPKAKEQSEEYGHSLIREVGFLTTHGMLHLLGYDHEDEEEEKVMIGKQEEILKKIKLERV